MVPQLVSPSSHGPDDTAMTPVQDAVPAEKSRRGTELSRISEDDRHRSSDHHTHTQVWPFAKTHACLIS